jgi:Stress responsive A/B Barrel Domain
LIGVQKHATLFARQAQENHLIRHTVVFKLRHPRGSDLEGAFLKAAQGLAAIPKVGKFECLRQVSKKNNFDFGLSMEFATQSDYDAYNSHPDHIAFVETRWKPEVAEFLEIDYVPFSAA